MTIPSKISKSLLSKNEIKLIIFDFDGVLANSFKGFYLLNKEAAAIIGKKLSIKQYRDLSLGNIHAGIRAIIPNDDEYQKFIDYKKERIAAFYNTVKLFPGATPLLQKLSKKYILTIASSTKDTLIRKLLQRNKVEKLFSIIHGANDYSKEEALKNILSRTATTPPQAIMVTDTVGDVLVAKKVGIKTIAVTWGFHSRLTLSKIRPSALIFNLNELESFFTI